MYISEDHRRNLREAKAKEAYEIYAHRTGLDTPFEYLKAAALTAWREIAAMIETGDPECSQCGDVLTCASCDPEDDSDCLYCGTEKVCPKCDIEQEDASTPEQTPAEASAASATVGRGETSSPEKGGCDADQA